MGQGPAIWIPAALQGPLMVALPFVQRGWQLWLVAASFVALGMTIVVYNITQVSFRQLLCPEHLLGRMNATIRFAGLGHDPDRRLRRRRARLHDRPAADAVGGGGRARRWPSCPVFLSPLRRMRELPSAYEVPDDGEAAVR